MGAGYEGANELLMRRGEGGEGGEGPHLNWMTLPPGLSSNIQRGDDHNSQSTQIVKSVISIENIAGKLDQGHKDVGFGNKADHYGDQRVIKDWTTILTFQSFLLNISKLSKKSL